MVQVLLWHCPGFRAADAFELNDMTGSGIVKKSVFRRRVGISSVLPIHAVPKAHPVKGRRSGCCGVRCGVEAKQRVASNYIDGCGTLREHSRQNLLSAKCRIFAVHLPIKKRASVREHAGAWSGTDAVIRRTRL
jgi:hypothetical protein